MNNEVLRLKDIELEKVSGGDETLEEKANELVPFHCTISTLAGIPGVGPMLMGAALSDICRDDPENQQLIIKAFEKSIFPSTLLMAASSTAIVSAVGGIAAKIGYGRGRKAEQKKIVKRQLSHLAMAR